MNFGSLTCEEKSGFFGKNLLKINSGTFFDFMNTRKWYEWNSVSNRNYPLPTFTRKSLMGNYRVQSNWSIKSYIFKMLTKVLTDTIVLNLKKTLCCSNNFYAIVRLSIYSILNLRNWTFATSKILAKLFSVECFLILFNRRIVRSYRGVLGKKWVA